MPKSWGEPPRHVSHCMDCGWEGDDPGQHDDCVETPVFNELLDERYIGLIHA